MASSQRQHPLVGMGLEATPRSIRAPSTYEDEPWRSATTGYPLNQPFTPRPATPSARGGVPIELFPSGGGAPAAAARVRPGGYNPPESNPRRWVAPRRVCALSALAAS